MVAEIEYVKIAYYADSGPYGFYTEWRPGMGDGFGAIDEFVEVDVDLWEEYKRARSYVRELEKVFEELR